MDNQRLIIWGFFAITAYLTWQTLMQQYGPTPVQPAPQAEEPMLPADDPGALPALPATDDELPAVGKVESTAPKQAVTEANDVVIVTTDVFEIEINTRGGTLQKATILGYPVAKDRPNEKVKLLNPESSDLGAVRSWLRSNGGPAPDANTIYSVSTLRYDMNGEDELIVPLLWTDASGVRFEKRFVFSRG